MNLNSFLNLTLKTLWPLTKKLTGKSETSEATPSTSETAAALNDVEIGDFIEKNKKHKHSKEEKYGQWRVSHRMSSTNF